jgi:hypothetical protein
MWLCSTDVKTRICITFSTLIFIYLFIYFQSSSYFGEGNSRSVSKQIPYLLRNSKITAVFCRFEIIGCIFNIHECIIRFSPTCFDPTVMLNVAVTHLVTILHYSTEFDSEETYILQHLNTYVNRNILRRVRALLRWLYRIIHWRSYILLPFTTVICNMILRKPTVSALEKSMAN